MHHPHVYQFLLATDKPLLLKLIGKTYRLDFINLNIYSNAFDHPQCLMKMLGTFIAKWPTQVWNIINWDSLINPSCLLFSFCNDFNLTTCALLNLDPRPAIRLLWPSRMRLKILRWLALMLFKLMRLLWEKFFLLGS